MKLLIKICISLNCLISPILTYGQSLDDLNFAAVHKPKKISQGESYSYKYTGANEVKELTALLFTGYKYFISSQDKQSCNFHTSCSVYSLNAIKKNGFFLGFLQTFDRLTRCHPLALEQYEIDQNNGLALDPVN